MKSTGLLIAAALLAVLTGVLYWSNHHTAEDTKKPAATDATKLLTFKDADVSKIEIDKKGTEQVGLAKGSDGKWDITAPQKLTGDQDAITGVISVLAGLNSERVVEDHALDLKQYGLADPSVQVSFTTKDGKSQKLRSATIRRPETLSTRRSVATRECLRLRATRSRVSTKPRLIFATSGCSRRISTRSAKSI